MATVHCLRCDSLNARGASYCSRECSYAHRVVVANALDRVAARFWPKVNKSGPVPDGRPELGQCWLWMASLDRRGYGQFCLRPRTVKAHRVSWELRHGSLAASAHVLHRCDTPACVNPDHLFLGDVAANMTDKAQKLRAGKRLTASAVREARALYASGGFTKLALAIRFGVHATTMAKALDGRLWRFA